MKLSFNISSAQIIIWMACIAYFVEPLQGYLFGGDLTKAGTNILSLSFTVSLVAISLSTPEYLRNLINKDNITKVIFVITCLLCFLASGVINNSVRYDLFALLRSIVLGYFLYHFCRSIPSSQREKTLHNIASLIWWTISVTIIIGSMTGKGLYTYEEHSTGYKFFYPSLNELSFVFFSSFLVLLATNKGHTGKLVYIFLTLLTFFVIGNKSFIALFSISLATYFFLKQRAMGRITTLLLIAAAATIIVSTNLLETLTEKSFSILIYILTEYSSGSSKLLVKLSYLDPFSALVSERDMLLSIATDIYLKNYGILETIFGLGYSTYGSIYGMERGGVTFSYSEMDPVDIFMSYGILGLLVTLVIATSIYSERNEISDDSYMLRRVLVILFFSTGALTGHLYLMGFPVFFFACYSGLCASQHRKLDPQ